VYYITICIDDSLFVTRFDVMKVFYSRIFPNAFQNTDTCILDWSL